MSVVELKGVTRAFDGVLAVDGVDLVVETGEFVTLLGPSGCGKTTTLRMIAGFVTPTRGSIWLGDTDVTAVPPHRREVGLVFQNYALFPHMTVGENVAFGLRMRGIDGPERDRRVDEALAMVRLAELGKRYPRQLSGGQQQRVALARALVIRPKVLLLDEPFGALDKQLRDHMRSELRALQQALGISTVFVTHDQEEAMSMSDRVCVMADGQLQQIGTPDDIYERPRNRFVADFMGRSNMLEARVTARDGEVAILDAGGAVLRAATPWELAVGASVLVMVRPERIGLTTGGKATDGTLTGRIASAVYLGAIHHVEVGLTGGPGLLVIRPNDGLGSAAFAPGRTVALTVPEDAVYLIPDEGP